ncbi:MAG: hypothetical protein V4620_10785 [Bacteroidota bacterium]
MTTTEIALLSSFIGAGASIITQFVANALRDKTDKKKIIFDLIAEERKLAYMIYLNQIGYSQTGFTIEYYYQLAVIGENAQQRDSSIERHHDEIKFSNMLHAKYCDLIGDYCKNIYKLILYIGHSNELEGILSEILNFRHEDVIGVFDDYKTYPKLHKAYSKKQKAVPENLETYKSYFEEMHQIIKRVKKYKA